MVDKLPIFKEQFLSFVADHLKRSYGSLGNFCLQTNYDKADLSRFLAGNKDWGAEKLFRLLLDLELNMLVTNRKLGSRFNSRKA